VRKWGLVIRQEGKKGKIVLVKVYALFPRAGGVDTGLGVGEGRRKRGPLSSLEKKKGGKRISVSR